MSGVCIDPQTIAECDRFCGRGRMRYCRVWDRKRDPEKEAMQELAGLARTRLGGIEVTDERLREAVDRLDEAQGGRSLRQVES